MLKSRRMNETSQGFVAYAPNADGKAVDGKIFVLWQKLRFESGEFAIEIPMDRTLIELAGDNSERICFSDAAAPNSQFFTFDESILTHRAFKYSKNIRDQLQNMAQHGEMARRWRLVLYTLLGCVLLAWLGSFLLGGATRIVISQIPMSWDVKEGNEIMEKIAGDFPFVTDSNLIDQLTAFAEPLTRTIPAGGVQFKFHVLTDPEPNAFAIPGGHIVITTGLLKTADRPEELLGVIAHETAHVTQRHSLRQEVSGKAPTYMVQILTGGRSQALEALAYPSELLAYESFSQDYEREADSVGWDYLVAANINPHGMIDMFNKFKVEEAKMQDGRGVPAFASRSSGHSTMLKTTRIVLSASAASRKKRRTAASLNFCWVRTAIRTSAARLMSLARSQFTGMAPSTSGVSRSTRLDG